MLGRRPRHGGEPAHRRALGDQFALVSAPRLVGKHRTHVVGVPLQLVSGDFELRQREIAQRHAVGAQANTSPRRQKRPVRHQALEMCQTIVRFLLFGKRRREIQQYGGKFARAERLRQVGVVVQREHRVGRALRNGALGGAHHAHAVHIEPDEQHIGVRGRALHGVLALAAAQIQHHRAPRAVAAPAVGRPQAPLPRPVFRLRLHIARTGGKPLLEREALRQTRRGSTHGTLQEIDRTKRPPR